MTLSSPGPKVVDVTKFSEAVSAAEQRSAVKGPRAISRAAKAKGHTLSHGTVSKALNGTHGNVSDETVKALADVLPVTTKALYEALGVVGPGPYKAPAAADRLSSTQRDLINALIHQIVRPEGGIDDGISEDQKNPEDDGGQVIEADFRGPDPTLADNEAAQTEAGKSVGQIQDDQQDEDAEDDSS